jgi:hypothetical protein
VCNSEPDNSGPWTVGIVKRINWCFLDK